MHWYSDNRFWLLVIGGVGALFLFLSSYLQYKESVRQDLENTAKEKELSRKLETANEQLVLSNESLKQNLDSTNVVLSLTNKLNKSYEENQKLTAEIAEFVTGGNNMPVIKLEIFKGLLSPALPNYVKFYAINKGRVPIGIVKIKVEDLSPPGGINGDDRGDEPFYQHPTVISPFVMNKEEMFYSKRVNSNTRFEYKLEVIWNSNFYDMHLKFTLEHNTFNLISLDYTRNGEQIADPENYLELDVRHRMTPKFVPPKPF